MKGWILVTKEQIKKRARKRKENFQKKTLGQRSGKLVVIGFTDDEDYKYICKCDCGKECVVSHQCFKSGKTKSCGCLRREETSKRCKRKIIIGKTYGKLTVIKEIKTEKGRPAWIVKCDECDKKFQIEGKTLENGCGMCPSCRQRGNRNPSWNDGLSNERREKRRNWECENYEDWKNGVFERENYTCEKCGIRGTILNAHHKDGYKWCKSRRTDVDNGACLCEKCHKKFHSKYGVKYNTEEQYIAFLIEELDDE